MKWLRITSVMFLLISILPVTVQGQWEGWEIVGKPFSAPTGSDSVSGVAWCPQGKIVIAGGYSFNLAASGSSVTTNCPEIRSGRSGWRAALAFSTPITIRENHFDVYAICVNSQQGGGIIPTPSPQPQPNPPSPGITWDLTGTWIGGRATITQSGDQLSVRMPGRGTFKGSFIEADTIKVNFTDDPGCCTAKVVDGDTLSWSNGTTWRKQK
jgi:hypothetical protein